MLPIILGFGLSVKEVLQSSKCAKLPWVPREVQRFVPVAMQTLTCSRAWGAVEGGKVSTVWRCSWEDVSNCQLIPDREQANIRRARKFNLSNQWVYWGCIQHRVKRLEVGQLQRTDISLESPPSVFSTPQVSFSLSVWSINLLSSFSIAALTRVTWVSSSLQCSFL